MVTPIIKYIKLYRFVKGRRKVHATSSVRRSDHLPNKNKGSDVISTQLKYASNDFLRNTLLNILC